ncbi:hypothetical protein E2C01_014938 [Portunus trituberculatus]|uniref:Uncharacterized protein n=1 Tax=Portunus trituberculatus TaxID=210409 RepID=A0A5B7DLL6_PORTR|nr:hypothetical protein [Portunus trituberculatus]
MLGSPEASENLKKNLQNPDTALRHAVLPKESIAVIQSYSNGHQHYQVHKLYNPQKSQQTQEIYDQMQ